MGKQVPKQEQAPLPAATNTCGCGCLPSGKK